MVSLEVHLKFGESLDVWRDEENMSDKICKIVLTKKGFVKFKDKRYDIE